MNTSSPDSVAHFLSATDSTSLLLLRCKAWSMMDREDLLLEVFTWKTSMVSPSSKPRLAAVSAPVTRCPSNVNRILWQNIIFFTEPLVGGNLHVETVPLAVGRHQLLQCSRSLYLELSCVSTCILHLC